MTFKKFLFSSLILMPLFHDIMFYPIGNALARRFEVLLPVVATPPRSVRGTGYGAS